MDQVTQQNGGMVEQSVAANHVRALEPIAAARLARWFGADGVACGLTTRKSALPSVAKSLCGKDYNHSAAAAAKLAPHAEIDTWEEF